MDVETGTLLLQSSSQVSRILSRLGHHFQGTSVPMCSFQDASGLKLLETSVEVPRDLLDQTERITHLQQKRRALKDVFTDMATSQRRNHKENT